MFIDLFRHEQLVKHLEFRIVINLFYVGLLWSTFNKPSILFYVYPCPLSLPVVAAALPVALLIFIDSISMLLVVLFWLIISRLKSPYNGLRSHSLPIAVHSNRRCDLRFWHILEHTRDITYLEVTLVLIDLLLVSSICSFLWYWALYHVMATHVVEFALCHIFTL